MQAIIASSEGQEIRRTAMEEAVHAYPMVAFNLLKLVNSAVFNLKTKIVTLKQAVALPTFEKFTELLNSMPDYPPERERCFSLRRFEEHGRSAALAVQLLSALGKRFSTLERERLYTAALIHDIGRIFLVLSDMEGYVRVLNRNEGAPSVIEAEKKYFGTDHSALGVVAVQSLGITDEWVVAAVRDHHAVPAGPAVLVAYADRIVKRFGIGPSDAGEQVSLVAGDPQEETRLKVAVEETVHVTIGEALMHVISEIDTVLTSGMATFKTVAGPAD